MSVTLYDKALINKIKKWTDGTLVEVYESEELSKLEQLLADKNNDKPLKLPFIVLRHSPRGYSLVDISKRPTSYDGMRLNLYQEDGERAAQLNKIQINIQYQLDVYAKYYEEADAYMREIVFNLINYPKVNVTVPYDNVNLTQSSAISIGSQVTDNSSIPERLISGQFTRLSIQFSIPDAQLFDTRVKEFVTIEAGTEVVQSSDGSFSGPGDLIIVSKPDDVVIEHLRYN